MAYELWSIDMAYDLCHMADGLSLVGYSLRLMTHPHELWPVAYSV